MKRSLLALSVLASFITGCGKGADDAGARLASSGTARCTSSQNLNLVASSPTSRKPGEVANPSVNKVPNKQPSPGDYLPVVTTDNGEKIIGFPAGTTTDGQPIMATETAVTGLEGYPYETFQGRQGNCAPRAFEAITGVYNPYLEQSMNGSVESVEVGDRTFIARPSTEKPQVGQVLDYRPFEERPGFHAGVVTGYDENGDVIVATGWRQQPYQVVPQERIRKSYQEVQ